MNFPSSLKVAFFADLTFKNSSSHYQDSFLELLKQIEELLRIKIEILEMPRFLDDARSVHNDIYSKSISYYFNHEYSNHRNNLRKSTLELIEEGQGISTEIFTKRLREQEENLIYLIAGSNLM